MRISNQLKEDIILNAPTEITTFAYNVSTELTATLNDDNSISFFDGTDTPFSISAPYLEDAEGNSTENIRVDLRETPEGCIIAYTLDLEWLKFGQYRLPC
ncbi:MAG: hypothetical protein LBS74_07700 [Oscillospiraceae bacterium]|jgi:hypothetical protein|nr:hypothetical protein [Oscillospiraceae bacterium]